MEPGVDFYYDDTLRWSFGFDNPNKAAVLFACLFPLLWFLWQYAWTLKSPWQKWSSVPLTGALIILDAFCLFMTYSRGGVVAMVVAWLYLLLTGTSSFGQMGQKIKTARFGGEGLLAVVLVGLLMWVGLANRSLEPVTNGDASVTHRFVVWQGALEMAADNPWGTGAGRSGELFMQWYEPTEMSASYRTLVNSYLTFLVEHGWLLTALIVIALVLFWSWLNPKYFTGATNLWVRGFKASLLAFLVAGFFSTVMEEPLLWAIPGVSLTLLLFTGLWFQARWEPIRTISTVALSAVILISLYAAGVFEQHRDALTRRYGFVNGAWDVKYLQEKTSTSAPVWVVVPDEKVLGDRYGKLLRELILQAHVGLNLFDRHDALPSEARMLLVGDALKASPVTSHQPVLLLSPASIADDSAVAWFSACPRLSIFVPGIDEDGRAASWQKQAQLAKVNPNSITVLDNISLRADWAWSQVVDFVRSQNNN